jgi:hypothetical protein
MVAAYRQYLCGYNFKIFGREDQNFQWSRAYSYYSSPFAKKEAIWMSKIARLGCVPEVFDYKELVSWCVGKYIPSQRMIPLWNLSLVILLPQVFHKMMKLPEPTLTFKDEDSRDFLKKNDNGLDILPEFLKNLVAILKILIDYKSSFSKTHFRKLPGYLPELWANKVLPTFLI